MTPAPAPPEDSAAERRSGRNMRLIFALLVVGLAALGIYSAY